MVDSLLRIATDLRERVWGGTRLGAGARQPIGEAWLVGPANRIVGGPDDGLTLAALAARDGASFLGADAVASTGDRFPLLAKLLDPAGWLSVQVHPDDSTARALEDEGAVGKTEAWYVVETKPGAELLLGLAEGVDRASLRAAISAAGAAPTGGGPLVAPLLRRVVTSEGDTYLVPAGTLHAVGPGMLLFEIQQASDITYRAEDWGRPITPERPLHTSQALACLELLPPPIPAAAPVAGGSVAVACRYFVVEEVNLPAGGSVTVEPGGRSFHLVMPLAPVRVAAADDAVDLARWETLVVAASTPRYTVTAGGAAVTVLVVRVPQA